MLRQFEYEAKALFREEGIPTQDGFVISCARGFSIPAKTFPKTLKTQVLSGGRGKAVVLSLLMTKKTLPKSTRDFKLPIKGELPTKILVEPKVTIKKELYVSILIDELMRSYFNGLAKVELRLKNQEVSSFQFQVLDTLASTQEN